MARERNGVAVHVARVRAPGLGPVLVACTPSGVVRVQFGDDRDRLGRELERQFPGATLKRPSTFASDVARVLEAYLKGGPWPSGVPVVLPGAGFYARVWNYLRRIPAGQVRTYGRVAQALRRRGAARAVGQACGANPLPLLVPCHRVVAAGCRLGGFSGGLAIKRSLLELEGALPAGAR